MKLISPLNYAGNKVKLLGQILSLFQKDIDIFVDAFALLVQRGIDGILASIQPEKKR